MIEYFDQNVLNVDQTGRTTSKLVTQLALKAHEFEILGKVEANMFIALARNKLANPMKSLKSYFVDRNEYWAKYEQSLKWKDTLYQPCRLANGDYHYDFYQNEYHYRINGDVMEID